MMHPVHAELRVWLSRSGKDWVGWKITRRVVDLVEWSVVARRWRYGGGMVVTEGTTSLLRVRPVSLLCGALGL